MGADLVVVVAPLLDGDLGFDAVPKPLPGSSARSETSH